MAGTATNARPGQGRPMLASDPAGTGAVKAPGSRSGNGRDAMPKYVIEREMPGAGKLSAQDLQGAAQKSCDVLRELGPEIQWVESYVTGDKLYCVYLAPSEEMIREHARRGGFPANRISKVERVIDPTTSEAGPG